MSHEPLDTADNARQYIATDQVNGLVVVRTEFDTGPPVIVRYTPVQAMAAAGQLQRAASPMSQARR